MEGDCNPASITMIVASMTASLGSQNKSIGEKSTYHLTRGQRPQSRIVNGHAGWLDRYSDACSFENLNVVSWTARKRCAIFTKLIHDHVNDLIDVPEGFLLGRTLRHRSKVAQRRAIGMITTIVRLYHDFESIRLHGA